MTFLLEINSRKNKATDRFNSIQFNLVYGFWSEVVTKQNAHTKKINNIIIK